MTDRQRLIVFVDSLNSQSDKGTPYIVELHGGKAYTVKRYPSDFYSSDPNSFSEVLQTMMKTAPAESYGLVLWGHASGWAVTSDTIAASSSRRAYGWDYGRDGNLDGSKWMNITQMARALDGLPEFDFIFADCCMMMGLEVGYELRHATHYLIGSPAEIPGNGAPYQLLVPYLFEKDSAMYRGIVDTYYDYYYQEYLLNSGLKGHSLPLSVIDTHYLEELAAETRDILPVFVPTYPNFLNLNNSGVAFYWYMSAPMMYDVRAVVKRNVDEETFEKWDAMFHKAVPYSRMSMRWMTIYPNLEIRFNSFVDDLSIYGCVSMYIPSAQGAYNGGTYDFNRTCFNFEWHRAMAWDRMGWPPSSN